MEQFLTVTLKLHWSITWPHPSLAVQATAVLPTAKNEPEGGEQLAVTPPQSPVVVGVEYDTLAPHAPVSLQAPVMSGGQVSLQVGGQP